MCKTAPKQLIKHSEKIDLLIIFLLHLCYAFTLSSDFAEDFSKSLFRVIDFAACGIYF